MEYFKNQKISLFLIEKLIVWAICSFTIHEGGNSSILKFRGGIVTYPKYKGGESLFFPFKIFINELYILILINTHVKFHFSIMLYIIQFINSLLCIILKNNKLEI